MSLNLERHWYRSSLTGLMKCLLPFACLFRGTVALRRFLYRKKIKKSFHFSVPVIVVGNITVGGTGKTPFVIWLTAALRQAGYIPGIVSRGVGGKKQMDPYWVTSTADVNKVGDEAVLLAKRTQAPMVICRDRVAAVKELLKQAPQCNVIIADDGLQHYRLQRDIEIALIDGMRGLGNQQLLPAGPLREPVSRLQEVDFIVRQGNALAGEFSMGLQGDSLVSVADETRKMPLKQLQNTRVHAVAGIGNPERFFTMLRHHGLNVISHPFPDHYFFKPEDLDFFDDLPVIMTEKDAVKCQAFANNKLWYIPVEADVDGKLCLRLFKSLC